MQPSSGSFLGNGTAKNCLVVLRHPSEKSDFVSWDDYSIPFPTVSGKSFKIPWFQSPPTSYEIPMEIPIFWVKSSDAHDRPTGGVSFTEKTSSVWTWPRWEDLKMTSGFSSGKWGVASNSYLMN
jgi:hypothetical protein